MDSSSWASSDSSGQQRGEAEMEAVMDQRKRKRMISNRDSARRSRARKQKHLDGLMAQVAELRKENHQILTGLNATTQIFVGVESENAILRAQVAELSHRLRSLGEIASFLGNGYEAQYEAPAALYGGMPELSCWGEGLWNCWNQPAMKSAAAGTADPGFLY